MYILHDMSIDFTRYRHEVLRLEKSTWLCHYLRVLDKRNVHAGSYYTKSLRYQSGNYSVHREPGFVNVYDEKNCKSIMLFCNLYSYLRHALFFSPIHYTNKSSQLSCINFIIIIIPTSWIKV